MRTNENPCSRLLNRSVHSQVSNPKIDIGANNSVVYAQYGSKYDRGDGIIMSVWEVVSEQKTRKC